MKILQSLNFKNLSITSWIVIILIFSLPSFISLLQPGYFNHHDDLQIMRIYQMAKCFQDQQLPCRWVPDMGYGYGYPLFNYYPVMPYYLGVIIYSLGFNLIWSVKIDFILSLIVSAITMFFLGRVFWGNLGGFISAMFYLYAPYHALDVYVRGAMAEGWSLSWTPLVFLFTYYVITKGGIRNIIGLAVSVALFLMSHNPMALVFSPVMAVWTIILILYTRKFKSIYSLAISGIWGLGLAAFFTLPVLLESKYAHIETLFIGYFNYLAHFASLEQMFISTFWGFGGSIWGPNDGMSFQIGYLHWILILLTIPLSLLFWKRNRLKSLILIYFFMVFLITAFLIHPRSNFIWEKVHVLQNIQFPWRLLAIVIFASSFTIGSFVSLEKIGNLRKVFVAVLIVSLFFMYQRYFNIEKPLALTDQEKLSDKLWDLQRTAGIFDYLPKTAKFPPGGPALETAEILKGNGEVSNFQRGTNWLRFNFESSQSATVRLPIIDFPEWKLFMDSKETDFDINNDLGQPTLDIPPGKHEIYAKLYDTPLRIVANTISLISFLILLYILYKVRKSK